MLKTLILCLIEDSIRGLSGPLGIRLRRAYYRRRFKRCGEGLVIEPGVHILAPEQISLGDDVWIDRQAILIAGVPHQAINARRNGASVVRVGEIVIGSKAHIGIGSVIQGHGGVEIDDCFTSAPHAKIYSFSNDHRRCRSGTIRAEGVEQHYLLTPVQIGRNVWIGMNAVIVGHTIGANSFIKPGAVVATTIAENSIVEGMPARRIGARFSELPHSVD